MHGSPQKFHVSLSCRDLAEAVSFYRILFDQIPAKNNSDYAKFELEKPPLVLSLQPRPFTPGGSINHLGIRVDDSALLVAVQRRLEEQGVTTLREDGVECCYAKQTKFWVNDPDGNLWEIYVVHKDLDHRGEGAAPTAVACCEPSPLRVEKVGIIRES
jgi:catechol 2,3-dioxygenase-like lactoylglutathione lyase family enzyme